MLKKLSLFLFVFILTSCAIKTHYIQEGASTYDPVPAEQVKIFTAVDIEGDYEVIGSIAIDTPGNGEKAKKCLKEYAAKIGANAILDVKLTKFNTVAARTGLSGVAIRIK